MREAHIPFELPDVDMTELEHLYNMRIGMENGVDISRAE
jgi:hypothetical protein